MNQEQSRIKREDRKALKSFWIIIILAALFGGMTGAGMVYVRTVGAEKFAEGLRQGMMTVIPYAIPVATVIVLAAVFILYRKSRKIFTGWDGEEEEAMDKVDIWLAYALWLTSVNMIFNFFIFAAALSMGMWEAMIENRGAVADVFVMIGMFVAAMFVITVEQQKIVNLTKEINPEKYGSVYDVKFNKKWIESCDEAEKTGIYQCGYRAYQVTGYVCMGLWLFCIFGSFIWNFGVIPVLMVSVIWMVHVSSYCMESIRLSKKGKR